jgi:CDP-glucose 4,6-dehydratase
MTSILVTGANGFIGSNLVKNLSQDPDNYLVGLGFDIHYSTPVNQMFYGDIRDKDFISRILSDYEIDIVYHLAAQSIVRISATNPASTYDINIMGTVNLLEACRTVGKRIKSVVISTSDKAYGHAKSPYNEDTPLQPLFTYEASKACQDIIGRNYAHNYGVPVKIARCGNVYGPGDHNKSRLIPNSIMQCLLGKSPILYNGVHNYIREFVYIDDAIAAFKCITAKGNIGEAYCVGGMGHHKILDVIQMIISMINPTLQPEICEKDTVFKEIIEQWIDASKLKSLGWSPETSLQDGLLQTIAYYKEENNAKTF